MNFSDADDVQGSGPVRVYLALGSNLDDPIARLIRARESLRELAVDGDLRCSPFYLTRPLGPEDQPDFVNAVVSLLTDLSPDRLLAATQSIERRQGRQRGGLHWGPRVLDIDILLYGTHRQQGPSLTIPHPGIADRSFVLYPLADLAPELDVPGHGSVLRLRERAEPLGIRRLRHEEHPECGLHDRKE